MPKSGDILPGGNSLRDMPTSPDQTSVSAERMGVLSFTLSPSPATRWILPARVRSRRHNDVVFIGNTYIQLREFHDSGQLSDATAKLDLGTQIMGVKVISAKVEMVPSVDLITQQEYDEERFIIRGQPCPDDHPPQVVVLATASNELIYAYARNIPNANGVEFVFAKRALLGDVSIPSTFMRYMAIDPECKAMAVASYNTCTVFSLKGIDELKTSIDTWDPRKPQSFQPNSEQRMFQVDGHILKMSFLRAAAEEPHRIILLLIVVKNKATLLLPYTWDAREPLVHIQPMKGVVQRLPQGDYPLLLIPSTLHRSFIIVTEKNIIYYDSISLSNSKRFIVSLPSSSTGMNKSTWAQWAKPSRLERYTSEREDILLVRDDGYLMMLNRQHKAAMATNFSPGDVRIGVDSAVCMLPGPRRMGGDILIVGGSMNDGGVFHLRARQDTNLLQIIPNVSPIHDLATIESPMTKLKDVRTRRTFVTAGLRETSSLNDLRYGQEAQIHWTLPIADSATISRIWTIEHVETKNLFIIASHPEHTTAMLLDLENQQLEEVNSASFPGLHLEVATLAAVMLSQNVTVQITPVSISVKFETTTPIIHSLEGCVCADIDRDNGTFAIACRVELDYHIQVGLIGDVEGVFSSILSTKLYPTAGRPSCLALFRLQKIQYLAVGYVDGSIEVLSFDKEGTLTSEGWLVAAESDTSAITSIIVFGSYSLPHALILTGTRNGKLKVSKITLTDNNIHDSIAFTVDRTYRIGDTPVHVIREQQSMISEPVCAFVQGGSRLDRIVCFENAHDIDYMLVNVWMSDLNDLNYIHPIINAVQKVQRLDSIDNGTPSGFLICATSEQVIFAKLLEQEQVISRRLNLEEHGVSFMKYSKLLNKFIVANNPNSAVRTTSGTDDATAQCPVLQLIDCDGTTTESENPAKVIIGSEDERVCFLLAWEPTDGKLHFDMVIVGLNDERSSRLGFISARKLSKGTASTPFKQLARYVNRKLYAICAIDKSSFAISVGKSIILMRLDITSKKFCEDGTYTLPSSALSLAAQGSVLYAATESHSMIILSWHKASRKWEKVLTDREAKNARLVLPFGNNGDHLLAAMANSEGTSVIAYPIKKSTTHKPTPLFEARMPLQLKHITLATSSWTDNEQYAFQGVTSDGTIYVFQTLTYPEWRLLHHIEQLAQPDPTKTARKAVSILSDKMARNTIGIAKLEKGVRFDPRRMHVNGDVLKRLIEKGPNHLRSLLSNDGRRGSDVSIDNKGVYLPSRLAILAGPVIGNPDDLAAAVIVWMRKLLRATVF